MNLHVLPGDALAEKFKDARIDGDVVVCRECLIEGGVKAENIDDFWKIRTEFIKKTYGGNEAKYSETVAAELKKLLNIAPGTEVNLWFEHELFCQTNMWFCLDLLRDTRANVYRVFPLIKDEEKIWDGFGKLKTEDLRECFAQRIKLEVDDITLGSSLWRAYCNSDYAELEKLSEVDSRCFPFLKEVCRAEIEKDFRPKKVLQEIVENGTSDFSEIFQEFSRRAGVYGYGDAQVIRIMREV